MSEGEPEGIPSSEPDGIPAGVSDKRIINKVFQAVAHLSVSMAQLQKRVETLDHAVIRCQDRLTDFHGKVQKKILGVETLETEE
jgi:hypothetical protein